MCCPSVSAPAQSPAGSTVSLARAGDRLLRRLEISSHSGRRTPQASSQGQRRQAGPNPQERASPKDQVIPVGPPAFGTRGPPALAPAAEWQQVAPGAKVEPGRPLQRAATSSTPTAAWLAWEVSMASEGAATRASAASPRTAWTPRAWAATAVSVQIVGKPAPVPESRGGRGRWTSPSSRRCQSARSGPSPRRWIPRENRTSAASQSSPLFRRVTPSSAPQRARARASSWRTSTWARQSVTYSVAPGATEKRGLRRRP
mmetsp:Transcript_64746/g.186218  ORF Transcript_64746/g.186218 Transcript_64746/m.186218 type:complete len:258 (-) Transcript_64746:615-1388(-)